MPVHRRGHGRWGSQGSVFTALTRPVAEFEPDQAAAALPSITETATLRRIAEQAAAQAEAAASRAAASQQEGARAEAIARTAEAANLIVPPIPRWLVDDATPEALAGLLATYGRIALLSAEGDVFDQMAGRYNQQVGPNLGVYLKGHAGDLLKPEVLVFAGPGGGNGVPAGSRTMLSRYNFRRVYQRAVARAGHDLAGVDPHGPHDLRHTFSTWLEDAGIPARVIDELMGHQRSRHGELEGGSRIGARYRHTTPEMAVRVAAAIQERLVVVIRVAEAVLELDDSGGRVF